MTNSRQPQFLTTLVLPLAIAVMFSAAAPAAHASTHKTASHATTPAPGSPERVAIMDSLRTFTLKMLGGKVPGADTNKIIFVVKHLKVNRDWAFTIVDPKSADNKWQSEPITELLHKVKGHWVPIDAPDFQGAIEGGLSDAKVMAQFRAKHPQAPRDIC